MPRLARKVYAAMVASNTHVMIVFTIFYYRYFNLGFTREILNDAGDLGLILMQHYVAIAHQTNPNMEDKVIASMLDKSVKTVEAARLKLTKAGWFKRTTYTKNGEKTITYDVGKEAVSSQNKAYIIPKAPVESSDGIQDVNLNNLTRGL
ncbi:hypothetical protein [uncultured Pseudoteredinibacter sp.]|uniref:hypothetical protein n=1 Tax=uncultured Pseudoteredinibacter sp. TaxID=1641701 RepID=UPI002615B7A3|nr:hypothetical protein [uncultured Pseudoteredinibacter sp.]